MIFKCYKKKLNSVNFVYWPCTLRIVIKHKNKLHVLKKLFSLTSPNNAPDHCHKARLILYHEQHEVVNPTVSSNIHGLQKNRNHMIVSIVVATVRSSVFYQLEHNDPQFGCRWLGSCHMMSFRCSNCWTWWIIDVMLSGTREPLLLGLKHR